MTIQGKGADDMEKGTFIKLDRGIQSWRWYTNANTFRVFLHILMNANIKPHDFENITINRGEMATSYDKIARILKLTDRQVRTAIEHLKETGEVSIKRYSKFLVITVLNYNQYQDNMSGKKSIKSQSNVNQKSIKSQQYKNDKKEKKEKKEKNNALPGECHTDFDVQKYDF